ncbi:hypothetical protein QTG54_011943 [Skeletonema marinoi]|uniref:C3H1-type domain-containing protein n=1 Tax=Skeletonema marinoi TaxID=267567 RepID=A0AAD8Y025_9STRA|nr:hypothetical protein QTG54_011943 [Skeletonema marinoi]
MSRRFVRGAPPSSNGGGNNKWTASSSSSSYHNSARGRGRGQGRGRSFGRGGRFSNHSFVRNEAPTASNKWVRPTNTEKQVGDDNQADATVDVKSDELAGFPAENTIRDGSKNKDLSDAKAEETITSSSDVHKSEQNLEPRGKHKLVIKKKNETEIPSEDRVEGIIDPVPTESTEEISSDVHKLDKHLERRGMHKLVMKKNEPAISSPTEHVTLRAETKTEETITLDVHKPEQILERRGRHKLVTKTDETETMSKSNQMKSTEDSGKYSWQRKSAELSAPSNDEETDATKQDGIQNERAASRTSPPVKRKRPDTIHGPRRICLSSAATEEGKDADGMDEQPQKTMTDFQYKDASARGGRGRGRGKGKAMGLVRVKPKNPSETPICPTFSRGLPCNNAKCRLRHDVSTEASRPICVFFQRNGMCSKGDDCPFKHVKISWDAEICPTFKRLGYCEDEGCVLRHVASKRSKKK